MRPFGPTAYAETPERCTVDTIFETDLSVLKTTDADGIIWVKEVRTTSASAWS